MPRLEKVHGGERLILFKLREKLARKKVNEVNRFKKALAYISLVLLFISLLPLQAYATTYDWWGYNISPAYYSGATGNLKVNYIQNGVLSFQGAFSGYGTGKAPNVLVLYTSNSGYLNEYSINWNNSGAIQTYNFSSINLAYGSEYMFNFDYVDSSVNIYPEYIVNFTADPPPSAPSQVSAVTATGNGSPNAVISWQANPANEFVTGYEVYDNNVYLATVTGTSYSVQNLQLGSSHSYTVRADNAEGTGLFSLGAVYNVYTYPVAVQGLTVGGGGTSTATLTWTAEQGQGVTGYDIYDGGNLVATSLVNTVSISGLALSSSHLYTVSGINVIGQGPQSAAVTYNVLNYPASVNNVQYQPNNLYGGNLTWSANPTGDAVQGYNIYDSGKFIGSTVNLNYAFTSLAAGQHEFQVAAVNAIGQGALSTGYGYDVGLPSKVAGIYYTPTNMTNGQLTWNINSASEFVTGYNIYDNGLLVGTSTVGELNLANLSLGQHLFTVAAVNNMGQGPLSNQVSYTVDPLPASPSPTLANFNSYGATVTWSAVQYANSYNVYVNGILKTSTTQTFIELSGLTSDTSYEIKITAVNLAGESQPGTVDFKTPYAIPVPSSATMTTDLLKDTSLILVPVGGLLALAMGIKGSPLITAIIRHSFWRR